MSLQKQYKPFYNIAGFTIIELMVVVAIIGILASVAVASLNTMIPRSQTKSVAQQLRTDISKAKMEAIRNNRQVLVEFTSGPGGYVVCNIDDWEDECPNDANSIIKQVDLSEPDYRHVEITAANFGGEAYLRFNPRGIPIDDDGLPSDGGTVDINCVSDNNYSLSLVVRPLGNIVIE